MAEGIYSVAIKMLKSSHSHFIYIYTKFRLCHLVTMEILLLTDQLQLLQITSLELNDSSSWCLWRLSSQKHSKRRWRDHKLSHVFYDWGVLCPHRQKLSSHRAGRWTAGLSDKFCDPGGSDTEAEAAHTAEVCRRTRFNALVDLGGCH